MTDIMRVDDRLLSSFKIEEKIIHQGDSTSTHSESSIDDGESSSELYHLREQQITSSEQKRSVRFSIVRIREYNVVDELSIDDEPGAPPRRSLGWQYTERESDIEEAIEDSRRERNEMYFNLMIDRVNAEKQRKEELNRIEEAKKKGWKVKAKKMFKSFGKGVLEATSRASFAIATTPY